MTTLPSPPANRPRHTFAWFTLGAASLMVVAACTDLSSDSCEDLLTCCADGSEPPCETGSGGTGAGASDGGGATTTANGGAGGTGGAPVNCLEQPSLCTGATPACNAAGECVECTDNSTCDGTTPICNTDAEECAPCAFHSDCPTTACNIFTGACLTASPVTVTNATELETAISGAGAEAVIRVEPGTYLLNNLGVNAGVVALIADSGRPILTGTNNGETLRANATTTVLIERIEFSGNTGATAIVANGNLALDQVDIRSNNGGSGLASTNGDAELLIRNSIIAGNRNDSAAINLGGANLELRYSTVAGANSGSPTPAIDCGSGHIVDIRNSILFSQGGSTMTLDGCSNVTSEHSAFDDDINTLPSGATSVTFTLSMPNDLFDDLSVGDARLKQDGFNLFQTVALWRTGDPTDDIDGTPRPAATMGDMTPDVAGAHLGP